MSELPKEAIQPLSESSYGATKKILAIGAISIGAVSAFGLAAMIYRRVHIGEEAVQQDQEDFSENI